jgi:hypothetical protein
MCPADRASYPAHWLPEGKPKGSKFKFMEVRDLKGKVEKRIG